MINLPVGTNFVEKSVQKGLQNIRGLCGFILSRQEGFSAQQYWHTTLPELVKATHRAAAELAERGPSVGEIVLR